VLNSSDVQIYNNTFVNSTACIARNARSAAGDHFGWHPSTGPDVDERDGHIFVNNLLTGDKDFDRLLLYAWQPASLCERITNSQLKQLDYNVYVSGSDKTDNPIILWSPAQNENCRLTFNSLEEFRKLHPEFSGNSRYFPGYDTPLFKSPELGNYQLLPTFPGSKSGMQLSPKISKHLGQSKKQSRYVGAYSPLP
jgi:hypothetical protein